MSDSIGLDPAKLGTRGIRPPNMGKGFRLGSNSRSRRLQGRQWTLRLIGWAVTVVKGAAGTRRAVVFRGFARAASRFHRPYLFKADIS